MTDLSWPFFEERHRELARELAEWCTTNLANRYAEDLDDECRTLVRELGGAGFPKLTLWLRNEDQVRQQVAQAITALDGREVQGRRLRVKQAATGRARSRRSVRPHTAPRPRRTATGRGRLPPRPTLVCLNSITWKRPGSTTRFLSGP